jgi:Na+/alanine symporter
MQALTSVLGTIRDAVWGVPTMILLLGTGLLFTIKLIEWLAQEIMF